MVSFAYNSGFFVEGEDSNREDLANADKDVANKE